GWVVQLEEPLLLQILVAQHRRIEGYPDGLGMTRLAVMSVLVRRVLYPPARVPDIGVEDAGNAAQDLLHAPETSSGKHGYLGLLSAGDSRASSSVRLVHRDLSSRASSSSNETDGACCAFKQSRAWRIVRASLACV